MIAIAIAIAFGAFLRVRQYAARTSFWRDEAFVVLNVRRLSSVQLMGKLQWDQAAAPVFLWALRGMRTLAGESELSLRLPALLCSLIALIVFAILARRLLTPPAAFLAIGLLALEHRLIEYSAQVKQYSGDVLVSALILLVGIGRPDLPPLRRLAWAAVLSALAVWFSHTAAIVFGGVSLVLTLRCLRASRREALWAVIWNGLFAASFVALYFLSIRKQHTDFLYRYWQNAFPDWQHPATVAPWLGRQIFNFLQTPYRWAGLVFALLILLSVGWARRHQRWETWAVCAAPLALVIIAALAGQYPFDGAGRLTLFLLPELFLLCGAGAALAWDLFAPRWHPAWWILPGAVLGSGLLSSASRLVHPLYQSHIRPAVAYVKAHRKAGEALVLAGVPMKNDWQTAFNGRQLETLCYWPDPPAPLYLSLSSLDEISQKRFWVLAAFSPGSLKDIDPVLRQLRSIASEKDHFIVDQGGAAILFERAN